MLHYFIVHENGDTDDYSTNQALSPNVENFYPNNFATTPGENGNTGLVTGYNSIGYALIDNGQTLIANGDTSKRVIEWKFGSSENYNYAGDLSPTCTHRLGGSATSSNGKYVWVGGYGCTNGYTEIYENGQWTVLAPYPEKVTDHCVTFLGDDNNHFYVIGGENYQLNVDSDSVMEYDFSTDKYTLITTLENGRTAHGCIGIDNKGQGAKYLFVVGGHMENVATADVIRYEIDSNEWRTFQPFPFPILLPTLVTWTNPNNPSIISMFAFGGYSGYYNYKKSTIYRLPGTLSINGNWQYYGSMSRQSSKPLVVPYMNKIIMK